MTDETAVRGETRHAPNACCADRPDCCEDRAACCAAPPDGEVAVKANEQPCACACGCPA